MEQIFLTYSLSRVIVAAIMGFYKNTNIQVHALDGDTNVFDIIASVL